MGFITNRENVILPICKRKDVLDVGCISPISLHDKIRNVASKCVGIDIQSNAVKKLRKRGYNIIYANAETVNLRKKFDVIVSGEVIEHLSNQGIFLENMKRHLKGDGILIITTPNMSCLKYMFWQLCKEFKKLHFDSEHVLWHSEETLKTITKRYGFRVNEIHYSYVRPRPQWKKTLASIISRLISPRFTGTDMIAILKKA